MIRLVFISILLGFSLAMDAFSVSLANGLNESNMKKNRMIYMSSIFALFQAIMPLIGWICVHYFLKMFNQFSPCVPYIALFLLAFIGGKMLFEGIGNKDLENVKDTSLKLLIIQGVATSIDALSVGFTIGDYNCIHALISACIIGVITFFICYIGICIGKKFGTRLANKASILGGVILIFIGLEIFITSIM